MKNKYLTPELLKEDLYKADVMAASDDTSSSSSSSSNPEGDINNRVIRAYSVLN